MRPLRNGLRVTALISLTAAGLYACGGDNNNGSAITLGTTGDTIALTTSNRIVSFNSASPSVMGSVNVSGLQSGENLLGLDIRPSDGMAYALGSTGRIYTINLSTGAATLKSTLAADATDTTVPFTALSGTNYGVDFNPVVDRMRVVSDNGQNLRINVDTGATITDGTLNSTGTATRTGIVDAAYTNSFSAACRTTLYFIDTTNDRLVVTNDPNNGVLTDVGNLGVDAGVVEGFEINTTAAGANTALAAFTVGSTPMLYTVNLTTGAATSNGAITGLNSGEGIRGLALNPPSTAPTQAAGNTLAVTESNKLISFQNASPQKLCTTTAISGLNTGENVVGIDVRPANGMLYSVTSAGRLLTINTSTAAATLVATLAADPADVTAPLFTALTGTNFGVDFNPTVDRLRIVSDMGQNLRVNPDTGLVTADLNLNPAGPVASAAAYTNSFLGAGTTQLFVLDSAGDQLEIQGQPSGSPNNGDLQAVGALGMDIGPIAAFEINAINNQALAAINLAGGATSDLDTINLTTGAATKVNTIGGGERVKGLAVNSNPTATIVALTSDNQLVSFKPATINTFDTAFPVTGLQGGENLLGIDYRPSNGKLYGVTDGGTLYTLNPATGAATVVATLAPDPADTTAPFTGLTAGIQYAVDFNPTADRLRLISSAGASLRINADSGLVTTDTNLNPGTPVVLEAAYTANYASSPATTLLDLDSSTGTLLLQNPPNDGVLTAVGALGVTFTGPVGFDIVGGDNGLAIAALQTTAGAQSTLYRINVLTGAATIFGATGATGLIGPTGTVIKALTTQLL